jgi:hypothetical protein
MSTTTLRNLDFYLDAATGPLPAASTIPISALAWSAEGPSSDLGMVAPLIPTSKPRAARPKAALAAALFGAVSVVAALGAVLLDGTDSTAPPPTVVDRTASAPSVPSAPAMLPAPTPNITEAVVPAGAAQVTTQAIAPPKVVVSAPVVAAPPRAPDAPIIVGGDYYPPYHGSDPAKPPEHHDWDHKDWDHQNNHDNHDNHDNKH